MHPKQSFVDPLTPRKKHERHINTPKMLTVSQDVDVEAGDDAMK